jgi:CheY-like chemotaxis protein
MQRILIVDDDKAMRGLLRLRLSDTYEIIETGDPEEALGLSLEHKPDAILLDLMMPKFTGFELVQSLHNLSYTAQIPLFVITGESAEAYNEHCANLGARCVFQKPIDFQEPENASGQRAGDQAPGTPPARPRADEGAPQAARCRRRGCVV